MIQFQALGGLNVTADGAEVSIGGPRQRRLLAMLLIHRHAVVSADQLAEAVFAGEPTPAAATTLRSYVARIRKAIDGAGSTQMLLTQAPGYLLEIPDEAFDVARFERLVDEAGECLRRDESAGSSTVAREALALWRGNAYAEFAEEEWVLPEARRLEELRLVAHERLIEAELACGRATAMIPDIESLVRDHPLREAFRGQLMLALYRCGRHADALRVYRDYREVLVEELGLDPTPALADLERQILSHDPSLMFAEPPGRPLRGYRLGERLGTGRDGTVYAARLPGVERDLVVRVIREELADRPEFVRSFEACAHQVASLHHPAIVPVHDFWREPGGAYLVTRRMHGGTLADRLDRGAMSAAELTSLVTRIGGALAAAAAQGIAHGRVIPESVLFDEAGDPFLSDFAFGTTDPVPTTSDDVHDFAALVRHCLPTDRHPIEQLLASGLATVGRPEIGALVEQLETALAGGGFGTGRALPNPYKGLRAFDEADAADFHGRAGLIDEILARFAREDLTGRLVLVVGGSGTGKSSVVRAGLLPQVRRGAVPGSAEWFVTTMLPGSAPFKELAAGLRRVAVAETSGLADQLAEQGGIDRVIRRLVPADGQLLLLVDQFEELFTMATEQDQRAFLDGILHAASVGDSRLRVVATLRADFYDRPLGFQRFGAAVGDVTMTIAAMSPAELEAAIVEPLEHVGGTIEPALVAELVSAVVDQPAALPSLQFTLYELAEHSPDRRLTLAGYRRLGGVDAAIAARAEALYRTLEDPERDAVKALFERLVVVDREGEAARRVATRAEVAEVDPAADAVIDRWAQARLLTLDRHPHSRMPTVELAHEAMLRDWPRLRGWIEEDREALVVLGQLRNAAMAWHDLGRDPDALYRGTRLQVAEDVSARRPDEVPALEREFLAASSQDRDRAQREAAERAARQVRANRRLRIQMAAIALALVVALAGGFIALDQRRTAHTERVLATAREFAAASDASLDDDPERSILLALAAIDETRSRDGTVLPEAEEALHRAVTTSRILLSVPGVGGKLDWSPDGTIFVTEGPEDSGVVDLRDAETGESVRSWIGHDVDVNDVAFSSDGSMLATTGDDGALRIWDPHTGEQLFELVDDAGGPVWGPSFSPDDSLIAASWEERDLVRVVRHTTGDIVAGIRLPAIGSIDFSPDGERIVMGSLGAPIAAVAAAERGEILFGLERDVVFVRDVAWSPDGRSIATTGADGTTAIWEATTRAQRFEVGGHGGTVDGVAWSPDSTRLATASDDGTAIVWAIADSGPQQLLALAAQDTRSGLYGVTFAADGDRLMTGDARNASVQVWDVTVTGAAEWSNVEGARFTRKAVAFLPDGRGLVVAGDAGELTTWDVDTGALEATIGPAADDLAYLAVSGDGQLIATSGEWTPVDVWEVSTGQNLFTVDTDLVFDLEWSPDGALLAVAYIDFTAREGRVVLVDRSGAEVATLVEDPELAFESVNFSPDGTLLAATRRDERDSPEVRRVAIWDWERGEIRRTIATPAEDAVFDPTGTRIVTQPRLGAVAEVWDAETGGPVASLVGHAGDIRSIAYSADGTTVATSSADRTIRLWDPDSGEQLLALHTPSGAVTVLFSPDGTRLASMGWDDGIVRVWALDLDDLIAIAHERLTRGFTDDECRRYLHRDRCPEPEPAA